VYISHRERAELYQSFYRLLSSGFPVDRALRSVADTTDESLKPALLAAGARIVEIRQGRSLEAAYMEEKAS